MQNFIETAYTEAQQRGPSVNGVITGCVRSDNRETTCLEHGAIILPGEAIDPTVGQPLER